MIPVDLSPAGLDKLQALWTLANEKLEHRCCNTDDSGPCPECGEQIQRDERLLQACHAALPALLARVRELEEETKQRGQALADAANEIDCAGPVAHRIRVLKQQFQDWADAYRKERDDFARRCMDKLVDSIVPSSRRSWANPTAILAAVKADLASEVAKHPKGGIDVVAR